MAISSINRPWQVTRGSLIAAWDLGAAARKKDKTRQTEPNFHSIEGRRSPVGNAQYAAYLAGLQGQNEYQIPPEVEVVDGLSPVTTSFNPYRE